MEWLCNVYGGELNKSLLPSSGVISAKLESLGQDTGNGELC